MPVASLPARHRSRTLAAVLVLGLTGLAGCASTDDSPDTAVPAPQPATSTPSPAFPPSPSTTPTADPTSAPSAEPTAVPTASGPTLKQRLLRADAVPGLNSRWKWQDGKTRQARPVPFGVCATTDLMSIGATEVLERTFYPPDDSDDNAAQQIARFADATSAAQAWSVLGSWRDSCDTGLDARPLVGVDVPAGQARWYLVSWEPEGEETGRFEAFGMVRNGTLISVLRITNSGQDYNYPAGSEPMVGMVRAAAALLAD